MEHVPQLPPNN